MCVSALIYPRFRFLSNGVDVISFFFVCEGSNEFLLIYPFAMILRFYEFTKMGARLNLFEIGGTDRMCLCSTAHF